MLVIRDEQMEIFARKARTRFADELAALFLATYPREARQAGGPARFAAILESSIDRALSLGFKSEKHVTLFVALTLMLGHDFYTDPQLPWAAPIVAPGNKTILVDTIYAAAVAYLTATAGENCEYVVRALIRIRTYDLERTPASQGEAFVADLLAILHHVSPEKYDHQGEALNHNLIAHAQRTAVAYGITANRGVLLLATLMFMLGSGIDHDPLHPWAAQALNHPDQSARIDLLYQAAMAHITQSLQPDQPPPAPVPGP